VPGRRLKTDKFKDSSGVPIVGVARLIGVLSIVIYVLKYCHLSKREISLLNAVHSLLGKARNSEGGRQSGYVSSGKYTGRALSGIIFCNRIATDKGYQDRNRAGSVFERKPPRGKVCEVPRPMDLGSRLQLLEQICREHGIPLTVQRRAVLEALIFRQDHPTADQIFDDVQKQLPEISKATVYRVLDRLVELGLIRRLVHTGMPARYDAVTERHHHVTCRQCGRIEDVKHTDLDSLPVPSEITSRFAVEDYTVQFFGICERCREASSPGQMSLTRE
jgi:Fur family peroxide stress response transcriptional regulator